MNKFFLYLLTYFLLFNISFAETKEKTSLVKTNEELRAEYVLKNMQHEYTVCYVFYKIGAEIISKSKEKSDLAKGIESSSDTALKLAFETGELANMTIEEMKKKVNIEIKEQLSIIKKNNSNYPILLKKYAQLCKSLIQDKKSRITFWEKEAQSKFK